MTRAEVIRRLEGYTFGANLQVFQPALRVAGQVTAARYIACDIVTHWQDTDGPKVRDYTTTVHLAVDAPDTWSATIRAGLLRRIAHEVDEGLLFRGALCRDPHAPGGSNG